MGYFKCTILFNICTISFKFYLIMTLVVPCFDNISIIMVLLISALATIGATKPIFLDSGSPRGGGGGGFMRGWAWFVIINIS